MMLWNHMIPSSTAHCPGQIRFLHLSSLLKSPPQTKLLLDAVDLAQTQTSSSQTPVNENIPQQVTGSCVSIIAYPPTTEEVTLQEIQVLPVSSSIGAATTGVGSTDLHLASCFINKTHLKAISSPATVISTAVFVPTPGSIKRMTIAEERSPQYQEKGASVDDFCETFPKSTADTTTASGKSDDPIKLGDGLMYKELTERVDKLETCVTDIKSMLQQLLEAQKAKPTAAPDTTFAASSAPTSTQLWSLFQPLLHQQRAYVDHQQEIHIQKIRNMMEARFMDTQADIKAFKAHLLKTTDSAPPTIIFLDNPPPADAKKGEKMKQLKKRGYEDGLYIAPDKSTMLAEIPKPDGIKKVDVTTNAIADAKAMVKRHLEAKDKARWEQEKRVCMEKDEQGVSEAKNEENHEPKRKQPTRKVKEPKSTPPKNSTHQTSKRADDKTSVVSTAVGTSVVSTHVTPTIATASTHIQSTALPQITLPSKTSSLLPTPPAKKQNTSGDTSSVVMETVVETPVVSTTVSQPSTTQITTTQPTKTPPTSPKHKRRRIILNVDPSPPQSSTQPLTLVTIPNAVPFSSVQVSNSSTAIFPAGVQYPLDLEAVREEIISFYSEDDPAKRNLPSVQGYPRPNNIEEYLKLKAQQAEDISNRNTQGKSDREIQTNYQYLLTQVKILEQFSKDVCQNLSERADETLRKHYVDYIMAYKTYKGEKYRYKEWTISELESETARIQDMIKNKVKQTPPIWAKFKKNVPARTLQLKRMKEQLITANLGQRTKWQGGKRIKCSSLTKSSKN
ncbi:hypothetical protein HanIR_Chr16g0842511 [Helianthus annuus]|nr:hypothetical protein HanIR_Chr16g0842511 [Helianthus annuus]